MTTQRQRILHRTLPVTRAEKQQAADKYPARRFPVQHGIQKLQEELNAFNERIAELENEDHRGTRDASLEGKCNRPGAPNRRASLLIGCIHSERCASRVSHRA